MAARLGLLQWNCNGLRSHQNELRNLLASRTDIDVICLEETFLKPANNYSLPGYQIIRKDRTGARKGGLLIAVREGISYTQLDIGGDGYDSMAVKISTRSGQIVVVNAYMQPDKPAAKKELNKLFQQQRTIITGDLNAHNPLWGSPSTNPAGCSLEQLVDTHDYVVLNTGQPTRLHYNGNMSHLDVTLVSRSLGAISTWSVLNNSLGSDHLPTVITVGEQPDVDDDAAPRYKLSTANWPRFKEQCRQLITPDLITLDVAQSATRIMETINAAAELSIKRTRPGRKDKKRCKPLPYWNDDIKAAIKARNTARNKMSRSKEPADCSNYRRLKGRCQQVIKSTAKQHWHDYCSTLQSSTRLSSVWSMARRMNGVNSCKTVPTLTAGGIDFTTNEKKAELFADTFAAISSNSNCSIRFQQQKQQVVADHRNLLENDAPVPDPADDELNEPFALHELQSAISKAKRNKAPGEDSIAYEMLQHLPKRALDVILQLYNNIWSAGSIPDAFKHAIILPIPKPSKNPHEPSSYRPICLNSTIEKIMERLITDRLTYHLERHNKLTNAQTGFRKGRSTIEQIIKLQNEISRNLANNRVTLGIFIDFERAFDMIWKDGLLIKLKKMGISGNLYRWIDSFMSDRTFQVRVGASLSSRRKLDNGTPQGSPLSPLLFLIMINDLPEQLPDVEVSLFADDSAIYKSSGKKQLDQTTDKLQRSLDAVQAWCDKWGFKMSATKTVCVLFAKDSRLKTRMKPIVVNNTAIKVEKAAKFLGVYFDERLTWRQHFDYVVKKCKARLNLMRSVSGSSWGASRASLMLIYRALIRSVLDYGAIAFDSATEAQKRRLDVIQSQALRIATGAMTSTSLSALQVETGEPPLQIRRLGQQIKYAVKVTAAPGHPAASVVVPDWKVDRGHYKPGTEPLVAKVADFMETHQVICQEPKQIRRPPWTLKRPKIDIELADVISKKDSEIIAKSASLEKIASYNNHLQIYTDGSKTENGIVAAAFRVPEVDESHSVRLNDHVTIYAAEMTALTMALQWLQSTNQHRRAAVFSDSLSSLMSLKSGESRSRPNLQSTLMEICDAITSDITIIWIPGHSGLRHNEEVDTLAKAATRRKDVDLDIGYEQQDISNAVEEYCNARWQQQWTANIKGRHLHAIQPKITRTMTHSCSSRQQETSTARLRLGKCRLNSYLHQLRQHNTGLCDNCRVPETVEHYVMECPSSKPRKALQQHCRNKGIHFRLPTILADDEMLQILYGSLDRVL